MVSVTRRWLLVLGAVLILAVIIGIALSQPARDRNVGLSALGTTPTTDEWCMPISRAAAIARVRGPGPVPAWHRFRAKLFGTDYWAVEETSPTGDVEAGGPGDMGDYGWAVTEVDAHTGYIKGVEAGPVGSSPSDWNALPDRTSSC